MTGPHTDPSGADLYVGELYVAAWQNWPVVLQVQTCPSNTGTRTALVQLASSNDAELVCATGIRAYLNRPPVHDAPLTYAEAVGIFGPLQPVWRYASTERDARPRPEVSVDQVTHHPFTG
jgi:hypothetical protein